MMNPICFSGHWGGYSRKPRIVKIKDSYDTYIIFRAGMIPVFLFRKRLLQAETGTHGGKAWRHQTGERDLSDVSFQIEL